MGRDMARKGSSRFLSLRVSMLRFTYDITRFTYYMFIHFNHHSFISCASLQACHLYVYLITDFVSISSYVLNYNMYVYCSHVTVNIYNIYIISYIFNHIIHVYCIHIKVKMYVMYIVSYVFYHIYIMTILM